jgi:hypothetical protein
MTPNIKITAKQIRFVFDSGKVWMIQPLHVPDGVPNDLRGSYCVPLAEHQNCGWGRLDGKQEMKILHEWVARGYKI